MESIVNHNAKFRMTQKHQHCDGGASSLLFMAGISFVVDEFQ
jgi:hypothetical protein